MDEPVQVPLRSLRPWRRHRFIRDVAVGVCATVLATFLIWSFGIDRRSSSLTAPMTNVANSSEAAGKSSPPQKSRLSREVYASIQPGMSLWQLSDILGSPQMRQDIAEKDVPFTIETYRMLGVYFSGGSGTQASVDSEPEKPNFAEAIWQTQKIVTGPYGNIYQHIAVLLRDEKVVAKREAGVD